MLTRRKLLASTPALAAVAVTPAAVAEGAGMMPAPEHPWQKARRLCNELADALAEGDDFFDGPARQWFAEVHPSGGRQYCVTFGNIAAREWPRYRVSLPMQKAIDAHKAALEALNNACDAIDKVKIGREPTKAALRRCTRSCREETRALSTLCAAKPHGHADAKAKAAYLAKIGRRHLLDDLSLDDILALANSAVQS